ncbi:MAG: ABC transporter ATP-binding protein [Sphaerochaetaceae bacterium]|nr:ABC transporter ATP-binding protein [Spirochaetales bacterium]MDY5500121.1 ABC transporter ATP-binding protein [Sphaerochaetaceae bacterium]
MTEYVLEAHGITKSYPEANGQLLPILKGVDVSLERGKSYAIVGNSGSGKSTLLEILATLLPADSGILSIMGRDVKGLSPAAHAALRNRDLGFIFQNSQLLGDFNALENVMMPLLIKGESAAIAQARATDLLVRVGLEQRLRHNPEQLSGGERQRVAVARALACGPAIVFADEPTGSLDEGNARIVEDLLLDLAGEGKFTLLLVTHNRLFAERTDQVWHLREGVLA